MYKRRYNKLAVPLHLPVTDLLSYWLSKEEPRIGRMQHRHDLRRRRLFSVHSVMQAQREGKAYRHYFRRGRIPPLFFSKM